MEGFHRNFAPESSLVYASGLGDAHAWAADEPTHLVHFNGTQLMEPGARVTGASQPGVS